MKLDAWLEGRAAWLVAPALNAGALIAVAAVTYAVAALQLAPGTTSLLLLIVVLAAAAFLAVLVLVGQARLRPLRELAQATASDREQRLKAAIFAVRGLGQTISITASVMCVSVGALAGTAYVITADAPWAIGLRLAALGVVFAPLTGLLVAFGVAARAHQAMQRLAAELPVAEVVASLPPSGASVRLQVVVTTMLAALLPLGLLLDLVLSWGGELKDTVLAAGSPEARALIIDAGLTGLLWRGVLLALTFMIIAAALGRALGAVLGDPMRRVAEDAARIATGELTKAQLFAAEGDVWAVTSGFSRMKERLVDLVLQLKHASERTGGATGTLLGSSRQYEQGAGQQAAALNQTSATTEELAHSARQIASNANAVLQIADGTQRAADAGRESSEAFAAAVERMRRENKLISDAVERLKGRVQQIHRVVEVINGVADRSDLLALSAELEGTRAGEVGRGFSLVATEMRRLAENVLESTAEVEELIGEIREATLVTTHATQRGSQLAEASMVIADEVAKALGDVGELARETSRSVRSISLATQQQQTGTDQLAEAMADILSVTQQNLNATRALAEVNHRLGTLSRTLDAAVDRFRIVS